MKQQLMLIGRFASRTRLSHKALRLYDSVGLLSPAFIDENSGYRYYREEQVEQARLITLLRQLEMPLDRIREVLALDGSQRFIAISAYWEGQEAQFRRKRSLIRFLESFLEGKGGHMFEVQTREVPEQKVITIRSNVYAEELPQFIGTTMGQLLDYLGERQITPQPFPFVAYHGEVNIDSDGPVEVCIPVAGQVDPSDGMTVRVEPAHKQAFARVTKGQVAFPAILEAYEAVEKYLRQNGKRSVGAPREVYFAEWSKAGDDEYVADIAFPFSD